METTETPIYHLKKAVRGKDDRVEDFNGPLDLILSLLAKNKMEIQNIQIAVLLDQYLAWMEQRRAFDLEVASEFVTMAAQLMFIKTRTLLSIHDEEARSELDQLIVSLEEHQRHEAYIKIQSAAPLLAERYEQFQNYIPKVPEHLPVHTSYCYRHTPDDLLKAMLAVLKRSDLRLPPPMAAFERIVGREPYPVAEKAEEILKRLRQFGVTRFLALFQENRSRSEIVATFLAVLELCKAHRLRLAGTESECTVTSTGEGDETLEFSAEVY